MLISTIGKDLLQRLSAAALPRWMLASVAALFLPAQLLGYYSHFSAVIESCGAAILIAVVSLRPDLRGASLLDSHALRGLGRISMSCYVLHMMTFPFGTAIFGALVPASWSANFPVLVGLLVIAAWLLAIVPAAWLGYRVIEVPGIALGRRVVRMGSDWLQDGRHAAV